LATSLVVAYPTDKRKRIRSDVARVLLDLSAESRNTRRDTGSQEERVMLGLRTIGMSALLMLGACSANDTQITKNVQERLAADGLTEDVHVTTQRRIVHLDGVVDDTNELNRAEMAARNVPGVLGVDNRIVVKNPVNVTGGEWEREKRIP
jgi:hypothetical protein